MVNLKTLDLNLIRVFDALMEEGNALRAGQRLGVTQSAVSHALNRLRHHLGDDVFVRTRAGMVPTARAVEVGGTLREALRAIEAAFGDDAFDPGTARRRFVLAANDMVAATVGVRVLETLAASAPGIDLVIRPSTRIDLAEQIDVGLIDVALGVFSDVPERFCSNIALSLCDLAAFHAGHPAAAGLSMEVLARHPLAAVSLGGLEAGAAGGYILERGLARQSDAFDHAALGAAFSSAGTAPRFALLTPHFLALPPMLAGTGMIAIIPDLLAGICRAAGLSVAALPYPVTPMSARLVWHRRASPDPGQAWFRTLLLKVAAGCQSTSCV